MKASVGETVSMWKVIVAVLAGCIHYELTPVDTELNSQVDPVVVSGPSVVGSAVFAIAVYCVLWLIMLGVKAFRGRRPTSTGL